MTTDVSDLLRELRGTTCRCGATKRTRETFCGGCYRRLAPPQRRALYRLIGEGYEEAYADAVAALEPADPPLSCCGRCGELKPRTPEHFYFAKTGYRTGYCKTCQAAWWRGYWPTTTAYQRERRRRQQRIWWREHRAKERSGD